MAAVDTTFKTAEDKMKGAYKDLERDLASLRTGRANAAMLDSVRVSAYGNEVAINTVGTVTVADAHMLMIQPWDKSLTSAIEKGVHAANLGLSPVVDGGVIRVSVPVLTEDRRKGLVKTAHTMAEQHRVSVRNVRRHAKEEIDALGKKDKKGHVELPEDLMKKSQEKLQKLTDDSIKQIDALLAKKEKEIMTI